MCSRAGSCTVFRVPHHRNFSQGAFGKAYIGLHAYTPLVISSPLERRDGARFGELARVPLSLCRARTHLRVSETRTRCSRLAPFALVTKQVPPRTQKLA